MANEGVINLVIGKPFRCKRGHVVGVVVRRSDKVNRLHVLRAAQLDVSADDGAAMISEFAFNAVVTEGVVRCSICGGRRRFYQEGEKK